MSRACEIIELARSTIRRESVAVSKLEAMVGPSFAEAVELLYGMKGRAIVTGIGKSGIIAQKIVATFNSTGTPAIFMHAADAIHGDLGIIQPGDVVIALSKSGTTPEIKVLVPLIRMQGNPLVAIVSNTESYLAKHATHVLASTVDREACPNNLAPTTSTTAQLVIGDALAICLLKLRGFTPEDFAKYHPGGSLGKRLYLKVEDVVDMENRPSVSPDAPLEQVILSITKGRMGATAVLEEGRVIGIVTDGDLRRQLHTAGDIHSLCARDVMTSSPKKIESSEPAIEAFQQIESNKITQLLVESEGSYVGIIHIHDLLREGIVG